MQIALSTLCVSMTTASILIGLNLVRHDDYIVAEDTIGNAFEFHVNAYGFPASIWTVIKNTEGSKNVRYHVSDILLVMDENGDYVKTRDDKYFDFVMAWGFNIIFFITVSLLTGYSWQKWAICVPFRPTKNDGSGKSSDE